MPQAQTKLKNYTTKIPVDKTVSEIEKLLVKHGAIQIMKEYDNEGIVQTLYFKIECASGLQPVKIPSDPIKTLQKLKNDGVKADMAQAQRVSWRIILNWIDAQLAILETEMVTIDQVLLPYFVFKNQTVYELYEQGFLGLENK